MKIHGLMCKGWVQSKKLELVYCILLLEDHVQWWQLSWRGNQLPRPSPCPSSPNETLYRLCKSVKSSREMQNKEDDVKRLPVKLELQ